MAETGDGLWERLGSALTQESLFHIGAWAEVRKRVLKLPLPPAHLTSEQTGHGDYGDGSVGYGDDGGDCGG